MDLSTANEAIEALADGMNDVTFDDCESRAPDSHEKPTCSFATLIARAIMHAGGATTLSGIYKYFTDNYSYFRSSPSNWRNRIRHTLTVSKCFTRVPCGNKRRGGNWSIDAAYSAFFLPDGTYVGKRGIGAGQRESMALAATMSAMPIDMTEISTDQSQSGSAPAHSLSGLDVLGYLPAAAECKNDRTAQKQDLDMSLAVLMHNNTGMPTTGHAELLNSCLSRRSLSHGNIFQRPDGSEFTGHNLADSNRMDTAQDHNITRQCAQFFAQAGSKGLASSPACTIGHDMGLDGFDMQHSFSETDLNLHVSNGAEGSGLALQSLNSMPAASQPMETDTSHASLAQNGLLYGDYANGRHEATGSARQPPVIVEEVCSVLDCTSVPSIVLDQGPAMPLQSGPESHSMDDDGAADKHETTMYALAVSPFSGKHTVESIENINRLARHLKCSSDSLGRLSVEDFLLPLTSPQP